MTPVLQQGLRQIQSLAGATESGQGSCHSSKLLLSYDTSSRVTWKLLSAASKPSAGKGRSSSLPLLRILLRKAIEGMGAHIPVPVK
jgi:hypothetical protein